MKSRTASRVAIVPRAHRIQVAGGIYKVGSRGNGRRTLFHDAVAYELFLELLGATVARYGWLCHTYCLMPNHFHLLVGTTEPNISEGAQWLKGRYAQWFNKRSGQTGHLFEGRFYGKLVESDAEFLELVRYMLNNPVRAGLSVDPGGWKWSSYRALVGEIRPPAFLSTSRVLGQFAGDSKRARAELRRFILRASVDEGASGVRPRLNAGSDPGGERRDQPKP